MMRTIRAASCQIRVEIDDPDKTRKNIVEAVQRAVEQGAELVVLPELATSGYCFSDREEAARLAEMIPGEWTSFLCDLSNEHDLVLVSGISEKDQVSSKLYSSAVVIDRGELLGVYRKTHLWDQEHKFFIPGEELPPVFSTSVGEVSVAVCYDIEFPEIVRGAAEAGAQILTAPVNWPLLPKPEGSWPIEIHKAMAHAAEYRIPIVVADRCGSERGVDWTGGSIITGADGYLLVGPRLEVPSGEIALVADVVVGQGTKLSEFNDARLDRNAELYLKQ